MVRETRLLVSPAAVVPGQTLPVFLRASLHRRGLGDAGRCGMKSQITGRERIQRFREVTDANAKANWDRFFEDLKARRKARKLRELQLRAVFTAFEIVILVYFIASTYLGHWWVP